MDDFEKIKLGAENIIPEDDLKKQIKSGKKLRVKLGMDPTAPDLHLGHAVVLLKLKQFQDLGHEIIFLIGDFTASIGDPTGKSKTRPPLTDQEIQQNTKTYFEQVSRILNPEKFTVRYNSEWLGDLTSKEIVQLCSKVTLARVIEREDFSSRMSKNQPIGFHELLYPLFQGYDSVVLKADVELGGTDQTFNLLMGRFIQEQYGQKPQIILTVPILEGLDGIEKMSKSLGNAIGLTEPANEAYGKLMSISDDLMWRYYKVLLLKNDNEIKSMKLDVSKNKLHPMDLKKEMAREIIYKFWSKDQAKKAQDTFEELFQKKDYSHAKAIDCKEFLGKEIWIVDLLKHFGAVNSSSEARRLIQNGAVSVDNEKILDFKANIKVSSGQHFKVGKFKFYKVS